VRARTPDHEGRVDRDGVGIGYQVYGERGPTVLLLPTWTIIHNRFWKAQVPYLARHFRVVTYDGPGNGRSDRPTDPAAYAHDAQVGYALAVLDATATDAAGLVSLSKGSYWSLDLAANHPERVLGSAYIGSGLNLADDHEHRVAHRPPPGTMPEGLAPSRVPGLGADPVTDWAKACVPYVLHHHEDFLWFFFGQCFPEPHSTKPIEDCARWGLDTTPAVLHADAQAPAPDRATLERWCVAVSSPVLVIHGDDDRIAPLHRAERLAELTGGELVVLAGAGHIPLARDPVKINLLVRDFLGQALPRQPRGLQQHCDTPTASLVSHDHSGQEADMRARTPDHTGYAEQGGVKISYEVFGDGAPAVLFLPAAPITHSREWKGQVPYLSRHFRVVTYDGRGNGRSDRPSDPAAYTDAEYVADVLAVMDAAGLDEAVLVTHCHSARWGLSVATDQPQRVRGIVAIAPGMPFLTPPHPHGKDLTDRFEDVVDRPEGWRLANRHHWAGGGYPEWIHFFFSQLLPEPRSTKPHEDAVAWALETSPEVMLADWDSSGVRPADVQESEAMCRGLSCPVLVIHGDADMCQPVARGERVAELTGGELVVLEGAGHMPLARDPVRVSMLVRDFAASLAPGRSAGRPSRRVWPRARRRQRRVLYVSSPIGLGHAQRDVAVVQRLREHHPDLQVDWLAQHPVTRVLESAGERVHPASYALANESAHMESESAEHDLHAFQAIREMDEILVNNFMVFHDLVEAEPYDLVVGDEGWDIDHFLHENPELKRFAYAWFTDFVGWLPMPDGGEREALLTADYNAEMIEQIARFPRIRDRAIFVGDPDDIVPDRFGPGLPDIREWTQRHYDFAGYVTGFDPAPVADREALRAELGYRPDEQVCVVTVGGSGVGGHLLRKVIAAYPTVARKVPGLRMEVVAGPRIDPSSLPSHEGLRVRAFVPQLYRHLAACDLAVVQGGLTTCMELTATGRPFIYLPLRHHFEQNLHVHHRLRRYRAGVRLDYDQADPDRLAELIAAHIGTATDYRPVATDGAARAATLLAELL
jgi:pimeloyl-ACP methyl ester carboxylesterase